MFGSHENMKMPKVSVIVPVYNREKYIEATLESVLAQTFQDFEIIVVDDGSVDNTRSIVGNLQKKNPDRFHYVFQENKGVASARNKGISIAKGKYISFLDSDDIWYPNKMQLQIKVFESSPEVGLVYSSYSLFGDDNIIVPNALAREFDVLPEGYVLSELLLRCFISSSTVMIKKEILLEMDGFNEMLAIGEDYNLWLRVAKKYPVKGLFDVLSKYRQHDGNIMKSDSKNIIPGEIIAVQTFVNNNPDVLDNINIVQWKNRLARTYFDFAYGLLHQGKTKRARSNLMLAIRNNPACVDYYRIYIASFLPKYCIRVLKKVFL